MATPDREPQQFEEDAQMSERTMAPLDEAIPQHKSAVRVNPDPLNVPPKYEKGDTVNKNIRDPDGTLRRAILTVRSARWDPDGGYWEYQLLETPGAWIREKELKLNKKRA